MRYRGRRHGHALDEMCRSTTRTGASRRGAALVMAGAEVLNVIRVGSEIAARAGAASKQDAKTMDNR